MLACDPNGVAVDLGAISPKAGVEPVGPEAPKLNGVLVLVALAPKDPKVGAAAVEGVVCWGVPKLNCNLGASEGVVVAVGATELLDPNANTAGAAGADAPEAAVEGALNPNPLPVGCDVSLLANG